MNMIKLPDSIGSVTWRYGRDGVDAVYQERGLPGVKRVGTMCDVYTADALHSLAGQLEALAAERDALRKDAANMAVTVFGLLVAEGGSELDILPENGKQLAELISTVDDFIPTDYEVVINMDRILRAAIKGATA